MANNYINREFYADKSNQKWCTDVNEFNLRGEKCYLSLILDGFNVEVISYNTSKSPILEQINDMLNKAFDGRNLEGLIFHSDQGDNYKNIDELIIAIDDYINYYNNDRIKVKLKGLSPINYRLQSSN